ncbi:MAG TPA: hypothetical protein VK196_01765 [Magnetospirillum sp.]|nr:hypothetical protein [Magnetospirillum sp.]
MTSTDRGPGADAPSPFAALAAAFCDLGEEPEATFTPFASALATGEDPGRILFYLATLGLRPTTLDELLAAVNDLEDEEELHAWPVAEGVAVSVASDGTWHVFTRGDGT